jgi:Carboxypeptidase regulatory-like domain
MRFSHLLAGVALAAFALTDAAFAASVSGVITGPDGKPFKGAFVQVRNAAMHMTVSVLSDKDGKYLAPELPDGEYRLSIRAPGFKGDPKGGVKLAGAQSETADFALKKGEVRWADLSIQQGEALMPEHKGKAMLFGLCMACHGFQSRMASVSRDEDGWRDRVNYMRKDMGFFVSDPRFGLTDQKADEVVQYLTSMFSEDSILPKSPTELPKYRDVTRNFGDEASKIVYVEYEMPGGNRMPWSARPDGKGNFLIPYYGKANKIGRLDPKTGHVDEFPVNFTGTALIHSAVPAPDGTIWLTEQGANQIAHLDPATGKVTEYGDGLRKHTAVVDPRTGMVWSTGGLSRFDPKTEKFEAVASVPSSYGISLDKDGNAWFAEMISNGKIGKVDAKSGEVRKWPLPTVTGTPRRIVYNQADDTVWFAEFAAGKIGHFDPRTESTQEFVLPGPKATPYALGVDRDGMVWYSSEHMDVVGKLDPASGKVTEYPTPRPENSMRDFFLDDQGHMWFGSPPNDRVGYFYLRK